MTNISIRDLLLEKGMNLSDVAHRCGVDRSAVSHVVARRSESLKIEREITRILGRPHRDLFPPLRWSSDLRGNQPPLTAPGERAALAALHARKETARAGVQSARPSDRQARFNPDAAMAVLDCLHREALASFETYSQFASLFECAFRAQSSTARRSQKERTR